MPDIFRNDQKIDFIKELNYVNVPKIPLSEIQEDFVTQDVQNLLSEGDIEGGSIKPRGFISTVFS